MILTRKSTKKRQEIDEKRVQNVTRKNDQKNEKKTRKNEPVLAWNGKRVIFRELPNMMKNVEASRASQASQASEASNASQASICGYLWLSVVICSSLWLSVTIYGYLWLSVVICGNLWVSVAICGYLFSALNHA